MKERVCKICNTSKPLDEYYTRRTICKVCEKRRGKLERLNEGDIKDKPNTYRNALEKEILFQVMYALGWSFNDEKGIWYKESAGKDKDGNWHYQKA